MYLIKSPEKGHRNVKINSITFLDYAKMQIINLLGGSLKMRMFISELDCRYRANCIG